MFRFPRAVMNWKNLRSLAGLVALAPALALSQEAAPAAPSAPSASTTAGPAAAAPDAGPDAGPDAASLPDLGATQQLESIQVVSQRLDRARAGLETDLGASTYTIDAKAIQDMPGGDNNLLNQVVLQAPGVAQDSFGQIHVRGEHNALQYRINGIILPEGLVGFGQMLDPRLISSMRLETGALPAEYGLRTGGIIDITTKSGAFDTGGTVSIYGGSQDTLQPSITYGGGAGNIHYFFSADSLTSNLGIQSPDGNAATLHDHTKQLHGFGYLEDVLDPNNRLAVIGGVSTGNFQIPNLPSAVPTAGWNVNGQTTYPSAALNDYQRETTNFGILSWQHSHGAWDWQSSLTVHASTLNFTPSPLGDLLFSGISQAAYKKNTAYAWQTDSSYLLNDTHTLRAGWFMQVDQSVSMTNSQVLPLDPTTGAQIGTAPVNVADNSTATERIMSAYVQDEWRWTPRLTVNYGLRADTYSAYGSASQISPRLNMVWRPEQATTVHAGYSRYFTPPPFELVGTQSIAQLTNTSALPPGSVTQDTAPFAERANYFDAGVLQKLTSRIDVGLDEYYKHSTNLLDEGQFGAPIIMTPFNYADGRQYGTELTLNYTGDALTAYGNLAWEHAVGRNITSAQFNFLPAELAYISNNFIYLDHAQTITASGGVSYRTGETRWNADFLLGSGLRASLVQPNGEVIPNGMSLPYYVQVNAGVMHVFHTSTKGTLTARLDLINLFNRIYEIRNGTGVGVGAPQYGAPRGVFVGLTKSL
ncbi:TonB-dependent receptor [Burkholderiales bacterium GJ-E10]|nr:TonB-dependent receptor [Burkholderiales bacterium GJ-E10]